MHMGKSKYSGLKFIGKLPNTCCFVVTVLLRTVSRGGAAMAVWDGGKGRYIPSTCCKVGPMVGRFRMG